MDSLVIEQIWGELLREGTPDVPPIHVRLDIRVREVQPHESTTPVKRILQAVSLSQMSGMVVEDGDDYILRYTFDGQQTEEKQRARRGKLYAHDMSDGPNAERPYDGCGTQ